MADGQRVLPLCTDRYYRLYNPRDSYPSNRGDNYALEIPANAALKAGLYGSSHNEQFIEENFAAWIEQLIKDLEATAQYIEYSGSNTEDAE